MLAVQVDLIIVSNSTPLHIATTVSRNYETAQILTDNGSDLGTTNYSGKTPLHQFFTPASRRLLSAYDGPLEVGAQDEEGMILIHYLCWSSQTTPSEFDKALRKAPFAINLRDKNGRSVLHLAASRGNTVLFSHILSLSDHPSPKAVDSQGASLLHYAIQSSRTEQISLILEHHGNIFVRDRRGRSALHYAARHDNGSAIQKILELPGSRILLHEPDHEGRTPRMLAEAVHAVSALAILEAGETTSASVLKQELSTSCFGYLCWRKRVVFTFFMVVLASLLLRRG